MNDPSTGGTDRAGHDRLEGGGLVLRRIRHSDIEQLRRWRNSTAVNRYMESRDPISPEMQERWFAGLDPARDFFYVVEEQGRGLGVVNFKNVDSARRTGESGIYLADPGTRGRGLGRTAYRVLLDHGFEGIGLDVVTAHVLTDNPASIRVHVSLGFRLGEGQGSLYNQLYVLRKEDYLRP